MNTLRELGVFVGIPEDSPEFGAPSRIGMRLAGSLLEPVIGRDQRRSLRSMIDALDTLRPITLEAKLLSADNGVEPFETEIQLSACDGLVLFTRIQYIQQNGTGFGQSDNLLGSAIASYRGQLGPGTFHVLVRRTGIGRTGYVVLTKSFDVFVRAQASQAPQPEVPESAIRPSITVEQEGQLSKRKFKVKGFNFLKRQPTPGITVRAVNGVDPQNWIHMYTSSDRDGKIELTTGEIDIGQLPRNAFGQAQLDFSACDSRKDPTSAPSNEPLWSNVVPFIY